MALLALLVQVVQKVSRVLLVLLVVLLLGVLLLVPPCVELECFEVSCWVWVFQDVSQVWWEGQYYSRLHPQTLFERVQAMVKDERWSREAGMLCEPEWPVPISTDGAQSSGQLADW